MQKDKYRPPYERVSQEFPRRCVFAMTTNQEEYLKDETGNRRWLPVTVKLPEANVEWILANRDQMFAEAYERVIVNKERIYEFPKEDTLLEQEKRRVQDPNVENIVEWYFNKLTPDDRRRGASVYQAYRDVFNGGFTGGKPLDKYHEMVIAGVFRVQLKLTKRRARVSGIQSMRWFDDGDVWKDVNDSQKSMSKDDIIEHAMANM